MNKKAKRNKDLENLPEGQYYIQNRDRGFVGNSILLWAKNDAGYTTKVDKAQLYNKKEMLERCMNCERQIPWRNFQNIFCCLPNVDIQNIDFQQSLKSN